MEQANFLASMEPAMRRKLLAQGRRRLYEPGAVIFRQGEDGGTMLAIETGRAGVESIAANGQRILLGHVGAGDIVGELALLDHAPRTADVTAVTRVTGTLLTFADLRAFLVGAPEVMFGVLLDIVGKLRAANALAENRALDSGASRLAGCLLTLAERWGAPRGPGETVITEVFPQRVLGQMAVLSRESVNRRLRAWSREGWIALEDGRIVIRARDTLSRIAQAAGDVG